MTATRLAPVALVVALILAARPAVALAGPPSSEEACAAAVQDKVAWDREGHTHWEAKNLRRLCETTTMIDATIECFSSELASHGNWDRAIKACTEQRHEVEVLYVVPKDKRARPGIEDALAAMMAVTQRHYFEQLGVTFKLKSPLVQIVHIDEPDEAFKEKGALYGRCAKLAKDDYKADYLYKENAIVCFFETSSKEPSVGGENISALAAWSWQRGYDQFKADPSSDLSKVLVVGTTSHEMGHGFGLAHTENIRPCFRRHGVDLGVLPNLIMQNKADPAHVSVYDTPFHAEEKRLLLTPGYLPDCLPMNKGRPHPTWYLRHPLPPDNLAARFGVSPATRPRAPN